MNKLFLATDPPVEILLPSSKKSQVAFTACPFRLEVAGENIPSTFSEGSMIFGNSWNNWTIPKEIRTRRLDKKIKLGKKVKVIDVKERKEIED